MTTQSRFQSMLAERQSTTNVVITKMERLAAYLGVETIAPVLGYGHQLEDVLGLLRSASGAVNKNHAANIIGVSRAHLDIFKEAYGCTTFIGRYGVVQERPMDIEVVVDLLKDVFNLWNLPVNEDTFVDLYEESVERVYQRARDQVAAQQRFENPREESSKKVNPFA